MKITKNLLFSEVLHACQENVEIFKTGLCILLKFVIFDHFEHVAENVLQFKVFLKFIIFGLHGQVACFTCCKILLKFVIFDHHGHVGSQNVNFFLDIWYTAKCLLKFVFLITTDILHGKISDLRDIFA